MVHILILGVMSDLISSSLSVNKMKVNKHTCSSASIQQTMNFDKKWSTAVGFNFHNVISICRSHGPLNVIGSKEYFTETAFSYGVENKMLKT